MVRLGPSILSIVVTVARFQDSRSNASRPYSAVKALTSGTAWNAPRLPLAACPPPVRLFHRSPQNAGRDALLVWKTTSFIMVRDKPCFGLPPRLVCVLQRPTPGVLFFDYLFLPMSLKKMGILALGC